MPLTWIHTLYLSDCRKNPTKKELKKSASFPWQLSQTIPLECTIIFLNYLKHVHLFHFLLCAKSQHPTKEYGTVKKKIIFPVLNDVNLTFRLLLLSSLSSPSHMKQIIFHDFDRWLQSDSTIGSVWMILDASQYTALLRICDVVLWDIYSSQAPDWQHTLMNRSFMAVMYF